MSPLVPARLDLASLRSVSNALVVGMGRSGQEAARLLLALGVDATMAPALCLALDLPAEKAYLAVLPAALSAAWTAWALSASRRR